MCTLIFCDLSQDGATALHAACQEGHYQVAELLLQAGASVEQEKKVHLWTVEIINCLYPLVVNEEFV